MGTSGPRFLLLQDVSGRRSLEATPGAFLLFQSLTRERVQTREARRSESGESAAVARSSLSLSHFPGVDSVDHDGHVGDLPVRRDGT